MTAINSYATDGKCHNANYGSFNHECGKPATWLGTTADGFTSGFCDRCKTQGDEATRFKTWAPIAAKAFEPLLGDELKASGWKPSL
jgi:hypothetical protein